MVCSPRCPKGDCKLGPESCQCLECTDTWISEAVVIPKQWEARFPTATIDPPLTTMTEQRSSFVGQFELGLED